MPLEPLTMVALGLALLIGLSLGGLGGGGSVLSLPVLVYVAQIPAHQAVPMSIAIVGATSLVGTLLHVREGHFDRRAALTFAAGGAPAAFGGSFLTHLVSQQVLMAIFAALMLAAGVAMLLSRPDDHSRRECRLVRCILIGAAVGLVTGFLGVGGGFMIVPALVLFAGIDAKQALGTSLAIITLNSAAGLLGQARNANIDWPLTLAFVGMALVGMLGGLLVSRKLEGEQIRKAFGAFVILVACGVGTMTALGVQMPSGG